MNDFFAANKKLLILLTAGIALFLLPELSVGNNYDNSYEKQFVDVLKSAEGVGEVKVMSSKTNDGEFSGVIVVAEGAEDVSVRKQISDAAVAAFNVQPHKVQIFSYKQEGEINEN